MAATLVHPINKNGDIDLTNAVVAGRSLSGAATIWQIIGKRYLSWDFPPLFDETKMQKLWDLPKDKQIPEQVRIVLLSTFDRAVVRQGEIPRLVEAIQIFLREFDPKGRSNLPKQVKILTRLSKSARLSAVCWNQCTVIDDLWTVRKDTAKSLPPLAGEVFSSLTSRCNMSNELLAQNEELKMQGVSIERSLSGTAAKPLLSKNVIRPYNLEKESKHFYLFEALDA